MPPVTDPEPSNSGAASNTSVTEASPIREVWASNLEDEFKVIRKIVQVYKYISMDTEFPGIVLKPVEFETIAKYQYNMLKANVDCLKMIQLGFTFQDEYGKYPPGCSTWQFNFKFLLSQDMYAQDSITLLINSGIQFEKHAEEGVGHFEFAELLMSSGIVLMDDIKMISFSSGYDFGYLVRLLKGEDLPEEEEEFINLIRMFFPGIYDVKYLMKSCKALYGGLQEVAHQVGLTRIGRQHQAGSDSLLTGAIFFKVKDLFFEGIIDDVKYCGQIYGPQSAMNCPAVEEAPPTPSADGQG